MKLSNSEITRIENFQLKCQSLVLLQILYRRRGSLFLKTGGKRNVYGSIEWTNQHHHNTHFSNTPLLIAYIENISSATCLNILVQHVYFSVIYFMDQRPLLSIRVQCLFQFQQHSHSIQCGATSIATDKWLHTLHHI